MISDTPVAELISVHALRVGMFVRLDGGWMSHPFPLNNFKLTTPQQIATIRALGVLTVRWDPSQSDLGLGDAPRAASATPETGAGSSAASTPATTTTAAEDEAAPRRAELLVQQRAAQAECERQFNLSASACRRALGRVASDPEQAKLDVEALTQTLLAKMLEQEDQCIRLLRDTAGNNASTHALNVSVLSLLLGRRFGLSQPELLDLGTGALLHDIGKIGMVERLHHPDEYFTPMETKAYEEHVAFGLQRGQQMGLPAGVMQILAQHHEMADASGFPLKVGGERMSDASRIVAMVNAYDGLCNPRVAKRAVTPHEALAMMFTQGKRQFDTTLLSAFIKLIGVYPAGTTVQLTDDRLAVVVSVNSARPLKPRVLVHDPQVPREAAIAIDIGDEPGLGIRRSVKPQQLPAPALHYLAPRQPVAYYFEPGGEQGA
jgi:putative nucleotidyltransferase with HDIG domain